MGGGSSGVGRRKILGWQREALRLSSGVGRRKRWVIESGGGGST